MGRRKPKQGDDGRWYVGEVAFYDQADAERYARVAAKPRRPEPEPEPEPRRAPSRAQWTPAIVVGVLVLLASGWLHYVATQHADARAFHVLDVADAQTIVLRNEIERLESRLAAAEAEIEQLRRGRR